MLILLLFLALVAFLVPKYFYLRKALFIAFLTKRLKPTPDELRFFPSRKIEPGKTIPWQKHEAYGTLSLSRDSKEFLEELETISFLIIYEGQLLYEQYEKPFHVTYPTNSFSIAKSVLSTLTGIAITQGLVGLHDKLADYLNADYYPCIRHLTLKDLLTMSAGIDWSESERNPFAQNARAYFGRNLKPLIREIRHKMHPGIAFEYHSGTSLLLAMLLRKVTAMPVAEFTARELWTPLGAEENAHWLLDRKGGLEKAFCCFYAVPRDIARIGQLYLNGGMWEGRIILSDKYVQEAVRPNGLYDQSFRRKNDRYGMHWWIAREAAEEFFYARGICGQYLICLPETNTVIVRTGFRRRKPDDTGHPPDLFRYPQIARELVAQLRV